MPAAIGGAADALSVVGDVNLQAALDHVQMEFQFGGFGMTHNVI